MLGAVRGGLGAGQAAHLAVLRARLVHEGAVLAGPHGRRDGVGRPPHGTVLLQAGELHADRACGEKKRKKKKSEKQERGWGLLPGGRRAQPPRTERQKPHKDPSPAPPAPLGAEMLPTAPSHQPLARGVRGHGPEPPFLLQSCSMVAHCSDFFQVWASSSFLVLTASSNKLMLSWKPQTNKKGKNQHWALLLPSSTTHTTPELQPLCSPWRADPPLAPKSFSSLRQEGCG